jgi:hypothetical protein
MVKRFLFESRVGPWLLGVLERWSGLAIVDAAMLGSTRADLLCPAICAPGELCELHCQEVVQ